MPSRDLVNSCPVCVMSAHVWSRGKVCNLLSVQRLTRVLLICPVTHTLLQTIITENKLPPSTWRLMRNIGGQLNWLFNAFSVVTLILTFITNIYFQPVFAWICCVVSLWSRSMIQGKRLEPNIQIMSGLWIAFLSTNQNDMNSKFAMQPQFKIILWKKEGQEYFWQCKCRRQISRLCLDSE